MRSGRAGALVDGGAPSCSETPGLRDCCVPLTGAAQRGCGVQDTVMGALLAAGTVCGLVGYRVGIEVGAHRAARASKRTVRGR